MNQDDGFLTRWSRRKVQVQRGVVVNAPAAETVLADAAAATEKPTTAAASVPVARADTQQPVEPRQPVEPPPPTLAEAQSLTHDADFTRFVGRDVDPEVKNTALKTLFGDPHFNVMDGLDTYIDDYGKPDPLPPGMLRQMVQSAALGLFADEPAATPPAGTAPAAVPDDAPPSLPAALSSDPAAPPTDAPTDEDTDLRLQPDDDAGRPGAEPGAGEDPGRQR
ncbi:MAG: DUF3306 domain-containing protein [Rubrivivax sp.]|nr:DUF3306 domain-containing protein [Rubrivivax sp.]